MAKPRCKVGDLALIIKSAIRNNLGRVVRVTRRATAVEDFIPEDPVPEFVWLVESDGSPLLGEFEGGDIGECHERCFDDDCLMPLRPRASPRKVSRKQPANA